MPKRKKGTQAVRPSFAAADENGKTVSVVHAGDALVIRASGLRPSTLYSVALRDDAGEIAKQAIMSDRRAVVRAEVTWSPIGIDDPRDEKPGPAERAGER